MKVDVDRPSTWFPYRAGSCDTCWSACCRLPVETTASDMVRLGVVSADEARGSLKKAARRLKASGVVQSFVAATGTFMLMKSRSGDCVYLDPNKRRCTVYETRPDVCRDFPVPIGPRPGFCPSSVASAAQD